MNTEPSMADTLSVAFSMASLMNDEQRRTMTVSLMIQKAHETLQEMSKGEEIDSLFVLKSPFNEDTPIVAFPIKAQEYNGNPIPNCVTIALGEIGDDFDAVPMIGTFFVRDGNFIFAGDEAPGEETAPESVKKLRDAVVSVLQSYLDDAAAQPANEH